MRWPECKGVVTLANSMKPVVHRSGVAAKSKAKQAHVACERARTGADEASGDD